MTIVYAIRNRLNGECYVGSTKNYYNRQHSHVSLLRRGLSHNQNLQRAWKIYGESSFQFVILETCKDEERLLIEQRWLLKSPGYNVTLNAKGGLPKGMMPKQIPCNIGRKHRAEDIEKMKIAQKIAWIERRRKRALG